MSKIPQSVSNFLNTTYQLSNENIIYFRTYGFIKLKQVLNAEVIAYMDLVVTEEVNRLNNQQLAIEDRDTYLRKMQEQIDEQLENQKEKTLLADQSIEKYEHRLG